MLQSKPEEEVEYSAKTTVDVRCRRTTEGVCSAGEYVHAYVHVHARVCVCVSIQLKLF